MLHELPEDILQIIIDFLEGYSEACQVRNFALVCRALHKVAGPRVPEVLHLQPFTDPKNFDLFQRSLNENPAYRLGIRSIELRERDSGVTFQEFLCGFPNLRRLELHLKHITSIVLSGDLQLRNTLQIISIGSTTCSASELSKLLVLPQLRSLDLEEGESLEEFRPPPPTNHKSGLQHLNTIAYRWTYPMFEYTLRVCHNLRILECNVPIDTPIERSPPFAFFQRLSPLRISHGLAPVSQTLTLLNICNGMNVFSPLPGHDGTRLDLSQFVSLKRLSADAELFFAPLPLRLNRNGFYKLLPPSIEQIYLTFSWAVGIFFNIVDQWVEEQGFQQFADENLDAISYEWMLEIAKHKSAGFPSLEMIHISERLDMRGHRIFVRKEWDPPLVIDQAFDHEDIDLEVYVRTPRS